MQKETRNFVLIYLKVSEEIFAQSGLQRDLTDSTMLRNVGVACGRLTLAMRNISVGLERIGVLNTKEIEDDLENNSIVCMEFIQLKLRHNGLDNACDICKEYSKRKK